MLGHHIRIFHPSNETVTNYQRFMFRLRLERCFLDNLLVDRLVKNSLLLIRLLDALECRLAELITGHKIDVAPPPAAIVDRESSTALIRT
jgi:hypothetical protein